MDNRRLPRTVIDPKVRQVGFVTPGDPPPARTQSEPAGVGSSSTPATELSTCSSLSPVMILPPRHTSPDDLPSLGRASASVPVSAPVPVPNPISPLRRDSVPIGSYNPSESLLGTSPTATATSPTSRMDCGSEFSEEMSESTWLGKGASVKAAASFPRSSGEMMAMKAGSNAPAMSSLTIASVVKVLPGISEKDGGAFIETLTEGAATSKPMKPKTTKADRRAIQEAQRAAKAAAKESADAIEFAKNCRQCQLHGQSIHAPADDLHSHLSPWPFRQWGLDVVGPLPTSTGRKRFVLIGTDNFTKWAEATALWTIKDQNVINFIREN